MLHDESSSVPSWEEGFAILSVATCLVIEVSRHARARKRHIVSATHAVDCVFPVTGIVPKLLRCAPDEVQTPDDGRSVAGLQSM